MKITDILNSKPVTLSFEVFPPGSHAAFEVTAAAASQIAALSPAFLSVTYGAGGGTSEYTLGLAEEIRAKNNVEVLPHLTCVSSDREHVNKMISAFQSKGFENIMALRGDLPKNGCISSDYHYAAELIRDIRSRGEFCIGAACYPEGHPECVHKNDDIRYLKEKVDAGCDFLTTQLFFDNAVLYNFLYRIREAGITAQALLERGAQDVLSFGPALVENGEISVSVNDEVGRAMASNPRTAIAVIDELHYLLVVSDGRTSESEGLSLYELAAYLQSKGVQTAYNLDGGGSSTMVFNGRVVNNPTSGRSIKERSVSDIVYVG